MAIRTYIYPALSFTSSNPANGAPGDPIPAEATLVGGEDSNGDLQPISVGLDGTVNVAAAALPLPSGAATAARQDTGNTSLASIDGKVLTDAQLRASPVPVSGPLTDTELRATPVPVSGTVTANAGSGTFAVSAASLPLPTGAATEATLSSLNGKVTAVDTGAVTISSALPAGTNNIGDVDVLSLPALPAGNNNIGDVDAIQSGTWTVQPGNIQNTTAWLVQDDKSATATLANISAATSSTTLQASNSARKGFSVHNDSSSILYVKFGSTASATSYTVKLIADAYYELPTTSVYTGIITGIWVSATGSARVTELS